MVENYSSEQDRWIRKGEPKELEKFLNVNEKILKWIRHTKRSLLRGEKAEFDNTKIRSSLYRPFCKQFFYFEKIFNEDIYRFPHIFQIIENEAENMVICLTAIGNTKTFHCLMTNIIPDLHLTGDSQCFPFYTYDKDGTNRQENITDWALEQFQTHYNNKTITKWDIFYYVYAMLHHPKYRETYAANLKRELPRIPFAPDFRTFAKAGKHLGDLHANYEEQPEYPLEFIEKKDAPLDWKVGKMRLSQDRKSLIYNDFLTLSRIPAETYDYCLGNRSALEWIIDQYRIGTDKRSGITNDPNRPEDPQYIVRLIGKVIFVSLETVKSVGELSRLKITYIQ
jgi:predicted helicase